MSRVFRVCLVVLFPFLFSADSYAAMGAAPAVSAESELDVRAFGALCDANYYNLQSNDWYADAALTVLAHDDAAAIQSAVNALKIQKSGAKTDPFHASFIVAKKLKFPAGRRCRIKSPVSVEADGSTVPPTYMDNIMIEGYGAQLVAANGFAGVSRYYDTKHTEIIKAMIIVGAKNFGKEARSDYQSYNKIYGLQFVGNGDQDLAGIYIEAGSAYQMQDLHFERMGFGIKARLLRHSIISNIDAIDTHSLIYSYNNTPGIKSADPSSHWENGGSEGGNLTLSNIFYMTQPATMLEANKTRGALHFYNTGELKINNVTIFGGSKGIVLDGQGYNAVSGNKWNLISNVEIAETELEPLYFNAKRYINFTSANITWCFKNTRGWASADYQAPYLNFIDVRDSIFSNVIIDRDNGNNIYRGGHDIQLTNSIGNTFNNIVITGRPGPIDDMYSHFYLVNSTYNKFNSINCTEVDASIRWKYGLFADMTSDFNQLNDSMVRLIKNRGNEVHFMKIGNNATRNLTFD